VSAAGLIVATAFGFAIAAAACGSGEPAPVRRSMDRKLVILGVDGMDPNVLGRLMAEGQTPNLARLAAQGSFVELATTMPPQSPVAWSTFMTGAGEDVHGIFDFLHRDPRRLAPYSSMARAYAGAQFEVGSLSLPISGDRLELLRGGRPFWAILAEHGIPAAIVKVPVAFPPDGNGRAEVLAGMGVPDLLGTLGTFTVLTDDPAWTRRGQPQRGRIVALEVEPGGRHGQVGDHALG